MLNIWFGWSWGGGRAEDWVVFWGSREKTPYWTHDWLIWLIDQIIRSYTTDQGPARSSWIYHGIRRSFFQLTKNPLPCSWLYERSWRDPYWAPAEEIVSAKTRRDATFIDIAVMPPQNDKPFVYLDKQWHGVSSIAAMDWRVFDTWTRQLRGIRPSDIPSSRQYMIASFTVWRANPHGWSILRPTSLFQFSNAWPPWHLYLPLCSPALCTFCSFASENCPRSPSRMNSAGIKYNKEIKSSMCVWSSTFRVPKGWGSLQKKSLFLLWREEEGGKGVIFFSNVWCWLEGEESVGGDSWGWGFKGPEQGAFIFERDV